MSAMPDPVVIDLARYQRGIDVAAAKELWIESKQAEILADLQKGEWHSYNRDLTFYPRDAMQEVGELDPEDVFRLNTATAAFWLAEQGHVADKGEMKLEAAKVLHDVFGKAVELMAKNLADMEYMIEVMDEH